MTAENICFTSLESSLKTSVWATNRPDSDIFSQEYVKMGTLLSRDLKVYKTLYAACYK